MDLSPEQLKILATDTLIEGAMEIRLDLERGVDSGRVKQLLVGMHVLRQNGGDGRIKTAVAESFIQVSDRRTIDAVIGGSQKAGLIVKHGLRGGHISTFSLTENGTKWVEDYLASLAVRRASMAAEFAATGKTLAEVAVGSPPLPCFDHAAAQIRFTLGGGSSST